ncbi:MAG: nucleotide exchange factor GrpE [Clostridia bacterium]
MANKKSKNDDIKNDVAKSVVEEEAVIEIPLTPLELAQKESAEFKDMALRKMAELENYRRNNLNLVKETRDRTIREVLEAVLPSVDGFDRAEELIVDEKTKDGIKMIREQLVQLLSKYQVTPIVAVGQDFNPELHECIMQVDDPDMVGKVKYEIQKGYKIGDRILRYSRVAVGKKAE